MLSVFLFDNDDPWPNDIDLVPAPPGWTSHWHGQQVFEPSWATDNADRLVDAWSDPTDSQTYFFRMAGRLANDPTSASHWIPGRIPASRPPVHRLPYLLAD